MKKHDSRGGGGGTRSSVSGKVIKMKVKKSSKDKEVLCSVCVPYVCVDTIPFLGFANI